jgi:hypothetical protein
MGCASLLWLSKNQTKYRPKIGQITEPFDGFFITVPGLIEKFDIGTLCAVALEQF